MGENIIPKCFVVGKAANLMSEIKQEIPWTHSNMNISKCKSVPLLCQQILLTYGKDESHYKKAVYVFGNDEQSTSVLAENHLFSFCALSNKKIFFVYRQPAVVQI